MGLGAEPILYQSYLNASAQPVLIGAGYYSTLREVHGFRAIRGWDRKNNALVRRILKACHVGLYLTENCVEFEKCCPW